MPASRGTASRAMVSRPEMEARLQVGGMFGALSSAGSVLGR